MAAERAAAADTDAASVPDAVTCLAAPSVIAAEAYDSDDEENRFLAMDTEDGEEGTEPAILAPEIFKFRKEHGRTYHAFKDVVYALPNDDREQDRLDLQHHVCYLMLENRLFTCPAGRDRPLKRVLDGGCGTGIWTIDFADEHPEARVIGVDLSPIQPNMVPPNVTFYVDDLEEQWSYKTPFDFIYFRIMGGSIRDWDKLLRQSFQNLTPGGYVEILDSLCRIECDDGTVPKTSALSRWCELLAEACATLGAPIILGSEYKQKMLDAGFTNIVETQYKWPTNPWPRDKKYRELGAWVYEDIMQGLQGLSLGLFTRALGWTKPEIEVFLVDVRRDLKNKNMHAYWNVYVVYGQKPE